MNPKKISVLVIPHQTGDTKEFSFSRNMVYLGAIFLGVFFLASLFLLYSFLETTCDRVRLAQLENDNQFLEKRISDLNQTIHKLKGEMAHLMEKEKNIRLVFGFPEVDPAIREVGIGGPDQSAFVYTTEARKMLLPTESEVNKLLRQVELEKQNFEEIYSQLLNKKDLLDHTPSICPTVGYFSRGFGMRVDPFTGFKRFHKGLDIAADKGTPIHAPASGTVSYVGGQRDLGKLIRINHGNGISTRYGHLLAVKVKKGQKIKRGDLIGLVGNSGYSTGPHLHYEVLVDNRPVNPRNYILYSENIVN